MMSHNEGEQPKSTVILHFNDVYEIQPDNSEEIPGGAPRFVTLVKQQKERDDALVLFSGDVFNPSLLSVTTRGSHMVPVINKMEVFASVIGNHDLDYGLPQFMKLKAETNFPWIISNVTDLETGNRLADCDEFSLVQHHGIRIGIMGLVEAEWVETLSAVDPDKIAVEDFVEAARRVGRRLREEEGVDVVIALTHMRVPNDQRLAVEAGEWVDLILGGHDHEEHAEELNGVQIVKSGTDFRLLGRIEVSVSPHPRSSSFYRRPWFNVQFLKPTRDIPPDPEMTDLVHSFMGGMERMLDEVIGETEVELDARFTSVRAKETNVGNFVTDTLRDGLSADLALINSGTIRADKTYKPGKLKQRFLLELLPLIDPCVLLGITGSQLLEALENGVSKFPRMEGRFPLVSGLSFSFKADNPPGSRVVKESLKVQGQPIEWDKEYRLATKEYLAGGHDGYEVFTRCRLILEDERCPNLNTMMKNRFTVLQVLNKWDGLRVPPMVRKAVKRLHKQTYSEANSCYILKPQLEGRIVQIGGAPLQRTKSMEESGLPSPPSVSDF